MRVTIGRRFALKMDFCGLMNWCNVLHVRIASYLLHIRYMCEISREQPLNLKFVNDIGGNRTIQQDNLKEREKLQNFHLFTKCYLFLSILYKVFVRHDRTNVAGQNVYRCTNKKNTLFCISARTFFNLCDVIENESLLFLPK